MSPNNIFYMTKKYTTFALKKLPYPSSATLISLANVATHLLIQLYPCNSIMRSFNVFIFVGANDKINNLILLF
jgi:hypothetical protein